MDRIILIAQQIAKEGKTPNTALIKARLPKNVPLPAIIQALKQWQANPHKEIEAPTEPSLMTHEKSEQEDNVELLISNKIEQMLAPLKAEIADLKQQIIALKESH